MTAAARQTVPTSALAAEMRAIGQRARAAQRALAEATAERKHAALIGMADAVARAEPAILAANAGDVAAAEAAGATAAFIDRLRLTALRVRGIAASIRAIAELTDPVGCVTASWTRPNGLVIERVATPLGVVGVVYESRPNVTADAAALCLKAGNPVILRGGSDSYGSSRAIHAALREGVMAAGLPEAAVQLVPTTDRDAVGLMLAGLDGAIDVIVPRGGKSLVERVQRDARVPVFAHLDGNCHVYVHAAADLAMAKAIVLNSKMRRTGVCGAAETLLVDRACVATHLAPLVTLLLDAGCAVRGDADTCRVDRRVTPAGEADWATEYLDAIIAVKIVDGLDAAIDHIATYGSSHTESIVTDEASAAERFLARVDSAVVLHNASTQFADGGEFGMGAEIGIATGRLHARGPIGVEQLCSFKYRVRGTGQIRPA